MGLCLDNANSWLEESNILYHKGSYGHCCALLVHGAEALAQAYTCWEAYNGIIEVTSERIVENFRSHHPKMDTLFGILVGNYVLEKILEDDYEFPVEIELDKKKTIEEIQRLIDNSTQFLQRLMELRNMGIYVNYNQDSGMFTSPLDLKKEVADFLGVLVFVVYRSVNTIVNLNEDQVKQLKLNIRQMKSKFEIPVE